MMFCVADAQLGSMAAVPEADEQEDDEWKNSAEKGDREKEKKGKIKVRLRQKRFECWHKNGCFNRTKEYILWTVKNDQ